MALVPVIGERWEKATGTPIYQGYGLTETSPVATLNPFQRPKREAIGVPVPGTDVRFVDADNKDVAFGEAGELWIKGPQVMQGYWQRPDESAQVAFATAGSRPATSRRWMPTATSRSSIARKT